MRSAIDICSTGPISWSSSRIKPPHPFEMANGRRRRCTVTRFPLMVSELVETVAQPAKVDSLMRRMTHHEDAETGGGIITLTCSTGMGPPTIYSGK